MSCLSCVAVVDSTSPSMGVRVDKLSKKASKKKKGGDEVYVEEKDINAAGSLKLKIGALAYAWKGVRVILDDKNFMIYEKKKGKPSSLFPLHLCNVKPLSTRRFRVMCAPNKSEEFKAKDNKQMREWVTIIQEGIARQLISQPGSVRPTNGGMEILAALRRANDANNYCADCNTPDPKWVSVNIGCIICIECSGVHRQLGVTISKVRSFELDMWTDKTEVIEKLGNADVNSMYEARLSLSPNSKPDVNSDREAREKYIYDKYVCKLYRRKSEVIQPILNTQNRKKSGTGVLLMPHSNASSNANTPNQKRIHIGLDVFAVQEATQLSANYHQYRRPSFGFDITRRGSYAGTASVMSPPQSPSRPKDSPTPTPLPSPAAKNGIVKENSILEQRRFSLFQAR